MGRQLAKDLTRDDGNSRAVSKKGGRKKEKGQTDRGRSRGKSNKEPVKQGRE